MASEEIFAVSAKWPGTTIDGEPGIVAGILAVSVDAQGGVLLNVSTGPAGGLPEEHEYFEFVLSADEADRLSEALSARPRSNN